MTPIDSDAISSSVSWIQQGQSIFGNSAGDWSGYSVSLSSDGETLAIGSPGVLTLTSPNEDRAGYAKVYQRSSDGGEWKLYQTIRGDAKGDRLGFSVTLSGDGNTLAVGAPADRERNDGTGYVKVYHRPDGYWKRLGQTIKGEALGDQLGQSVSLSSNGETLAVGANGNDNENGEAAGHVRVFGLDNAVSASTWQQLGQDIDGEAAFDNSGKSVSLSSDGKTVAIGAYYNDGNGDKAGHARVYQIDEASLSWQQLGQDLDGEAAGDMSGGERSVSLSSDGKIVAIGATGNDGNGNGAGHVRVYYMDDSSSSWKQLGQDIDGEAAYDQSGRSVSLSEDGKVLAIGANGNDSNGASAGHVRVYHINDTGSSWKQIGQDIDGESAGDESGWSVSLSADGRTVVIGSTKNDDNGEESGHVRVFKQVAT